MRHLIYGTAWLLAGLMAAGCSGRDVNESDPSGGGGEAAASEPANVEPAYITVDHILIGVTHPKLKGVDRTAQDARRLAYELKMRIESGEDWFALKAEFSDDQGRDGKGGGPYAMANNGHDPRNGDEARRKQMVPAFGDVGFSLEVGEIAIADYDPRASKYGYHIIKRVK
jgi:hypothetical protein